jgi:lipopolysaccharide export system permease protein
MKVLDRYVIRCVTSVAFMAVLLCTLMLISVDLFANLDSYLTNEVPAFTIAKITLLGIPESFIFALGPSLLFSASFFLSQVQANNELICILGSGLSYRRLVAPILILGMIFSAGQFVFSEYVHIPASQMRERSRDELFGLRSTYDNRNITLTDPGRTYVVHAKQYRDDESRLTQVMLVFLDEQGTFNGRIDAAFAYWEEDRGIWRLERVRSQAREPGELTISTTEYQTLYLEAFTLEPAFFRNLSSDIKTMELSAALRYLKRIKVLDPLRHPGLSTDLVERLLGNLSPLVMLFIACTISYRYKKNVLLFSIITSLGIAVIYYVVQMVTLIMARQGVIGAVWGMVIPMIVIVCIALAERAAVR